MNKVARQLAELQDDHKSCNFKRQALWSYIHDPDISGFQYYGCLDCDGLTGYRPSSETEKCELYTNRTMQVNYRRNFDSENNKKKTPKNLV